MRHVATNMEAGTRVIAGGDFNTEVVPTGVVETTEADAVVRELVDDENAVVVSHLEPTYIKAGTVLDYWLATPDVSAEVTSVAK